MEEIKRWRKSILSILLILSNCIIILKTQKFSPRHSQSCTDVLTETVALKLRAVLPGGRRTDTPGVLLVQGIINSRLYHMPGYLPNDVLGVAESAPFSGGLPVFAFENAIKIRKIFKPAQFCNFQDRRI